MSPLNNIFLPLRPRREDPEGHMVVQLNVDEIIRLLQVELGNLIMGTVALRPSAVDASGFFYFAVDTGIISYSDGSVWTDIAPGSHGYGTTFPTSGLFNGYRFTLFVSSTGGAWTVGWDCIYRVDLDVTYPWFVVGGPMLLSAVHGGGRRDTTSFGDFTTGAQGPEVTAPRAGRYYVYLEGRVECTFDFGAAQLHTSFDIGPSLADTARAVNHTLNVYSGGNTAAENFARISHDLWAMAAGAVVRMKYQGAGVNSQWAKQKIGLIPYRLA